MSQEIQPPGDRVLIRLVEDEAFTKSGLVIPDTAKEKPQRGEVVAVGDDTELIKVAVGDRVLFPKYTGTEISVADADHLIIESTDLLAILRDAPVESAAA